MTLNATQSTYLDEIRDGSRSDDSVIQDLEDVKIEAYSNANYRELLFAIDSMNRFSGNAWSRVFVRGVVENSDWIENGRLTPRAFSEIGDYKETYGSGEYGIGVVLDLNEEADRSPANATSFARRILRQHFNGIQPVSDHALFLIKRFLKPFEILVSEDINLLFHVLEETKGLTNDAAFDRYFAITVRDACISLEGKQNPRVLRLVTSKLEASDEPVEAERMLIRQLVDKGVDLPDTLLARIDRSMDRLAGID